MTASYTEQHAQAEPLRLPDPALLFEARAARLAKLASGSSTPEFLLLLSRVARGQASAARGVAVEPARAPGGGPPLDAERTPRDGAWRRMLAAILDAARAPELPAETRAALRRLSEAREAELEAIASALLAGEVAPADVAAAPFVGAALQAWFSALAARLDPSAIPGGAPSACPVCGSPPVAGLVQGKDRLRYLTCALCAAEWNFSRLYCAVCGKDDELAYYGVEGDKGAKAEACARCRVYVKLFDDGERAGAEPAADDAATLALDLMLAEDGWRRLGPNLYLVAAG
ncbi:MAG TPA: formate dehydrogenase accessory protein FdhE [Anaeromyxobacter sp.]|nr:formate dehydrogenase accessory protein FdhE [Anaeromyxobacter sp.]